MRCKNILEKILDTGNAVGKPCFLSVEFVVVPEVVLCTDAVGDIYNSF